MYLSNAFDLEGLRHRAVCCKSAPVYGIGTTQHALALLKIRPSLNSLPNLSLAFTNDLSPRRLPQARPTGSHTGGSRSVQHHGNLKWTGRGFQGRVHR